MKKISAICCFILITVFSTGSYLVYKCFLNSYKKEFRSYLFNNRQQQALAVILINPVELYANSSRITWEDENKEIVYKGTLYDVVRVENRGMHVALIAVSDQQEAEIKKQFTDLFDLNAHDATKNPVQLLKNFFTLKCIVAEPSFGHLIQQSYCSTFSSAGSFITLKGCLSPETPPPDHFI